jgi:hypothetical protein
MIHLFHQGHLGDDAESFRKMFAASGARVMAGIATDKDVAVQTTTGPRVRVVPFEQTT